MSAQQVGCESVVTVMVAGKETALTCESEFGEPHGIHCRSVPLQIQALDRKRRPTEVSATLTVEWGTDTKRLTLVE